MTLDLPNDHLEVVLETVNNLYEADFSIEQLEGTFPEKSSYYCLTDGINYIYYAKTKEDMHRMLLGLGVLWSSFSGGRARAPSAEYRLGKKASDAGSAR